MTTYTAFLIALVFLFSPEEAISQLSGSVQLDGTTSSAALVRRGPYGRKSSTSSSSVSPTLGIVVYAKKLDGNINQNTSDDIQILNQEDIQFSPRLIVVKAGEKVRVLNSDPVYHNVFSLSKTKSFDIGRRQKGEHKDVIFEEPGIIQVFCDIHSHMSAEIIVVEPDVVAWQITEAGSNYSISLESGKYQITAYSPGFQAQEKTILIESGKTATLDFSLSK